MSETRAGPNEGEPKTSRLAVWSLLLGLLGFGLWYLPVGITGVVGLVLGIVALRRIKSSGGLLQGRGFAIAGILTSAIYIAVFICAVMPWIIEQKSLRHELVCATNLSELGKALHSCAEDHFGNYPAVDKWCDLLIQETDIPESNFVCPSAGKGRCHYGMNPDCERNSPGDVVLLFETKGGWNQHGGPEILTTENHKGNGCNILFNDGHVRFVPGEFEKLKWRAEATGGTE